MRQDLTVCALHHIQWLLNADNSHQFTDSHLWQYQALLLEGPAIQIWICSTLNLAKLFPETEEELTDNCQQVLMQTYAARADLQETPLDNPDDALHYESSFIENAIRKAAYAVVTLHGTLENTSLPSRASAQFAALIALTRALELRRKESQYCFKICLFSIKCPWKHLERKTLPNSHWVTRQISPGDQPITTGSTFSLRNSNHALQGTPKKK